jgi:hypothetical protein
VWECGQQICWARYTTATIFTGTPQSAGESYRYCQQQKMLFADNGNDLNLKQWKEALQKQGEDTQLHKFVESIIQKNLRNSVFVDVTADADVAKCMSSSYQRQYR